MKKGVRMLLVGSGIAAAGMTVVSTASYALAQKLVEVALDREEPRVLARNRERVSGRMDHGVSRAPRQARILFAPPILRR